MTATTPKAKFVWTDANYAIVLKAYNESKQDNTKKNLEKIAALVGAVSGNSVRSKLSTEKDYVVVTATNADGKKRAPKVTKVSLVYKVEELLRLEKEALDSLEKGNVSALENLIAGIAARGSDAAVTEAYFDLQDRLEAEAEAAELAKEAEENAENEELAQADADAEESDTETA